MQAYFTHPGTSDLTLETAPVPEPGPEEVLVRVAAAALNNADLSEATQRAIPGFELCGEVVSVGAEAPDGLVGTRVLGIAEGTFAQYALAHHRHVIAAPESLSDAEAAALPTALTTEYGALRRAGVAPGDTVLVTAATSGIGLHAVQVARVLGARLVLGTTRTRERAQAIRSVGADHAIVTGEQDLAQTVRELTDGAGADVVLDHVAGAGLGEAIEAARIGGSVVSVGRLASRSAEIDLFALAHRQVRLQSVSYGLNPPAVLGDLLDRVRSDLFGALEDGRIRAVVDRIVTFESLSEGRDRLASGEAVGKVVLAVQ